MKSKNCHETYIQMIVISKIKEYNKNSHLATEANFYVICGNINNIQGVNKLSRNSAIF